MLENDLKHPNAGTKGRFLELLEDERGDLISKPVLVEFRW